MNVSVDTNRKTALVRYVNQEGAIAAKASKEPILNNPNIKLAYEPPQERPAQSSVTTPESAKTKV